jgi:ABC-type sugar transport system permease subunit
VKKRRKVQGLLFCAPALLLLTVFYLLPALVTVLLAFFETYHYASYTWVGLKHYRALVDSGFLDALWVSGKFLIAMYIYKMVISYLIAVALYFRSPRFSMTMRTIYYVPVVLSGVVTVSVWRWILSPTGLVNSILAKVGVGPYLWFGDPGLSAWAVAFVMMMGYTGGTLLLWSAALGQIPEDIIHAAQIDGAGTFRLIWSILTPLTQPTRIYVAIVGFLGALQVWEHPWLFTGGGPRGSSTSVALKIFNTAFGLGKIGLASSMTTVTLVLSIVLAAYLIRRGMV